MERTVQESPSALPHKISQFSSSPLLEPFEEEFAFFQFCQEATTKYKAILSDSFLYLPDRFRYNLKIQSYSYNNYMDNYDFREAKLLASYLDLTMVDIILFFIILSSERPSHLLKKIKEKSRLPLLHLFNYYAADLAKNLYNIIVEEGSGSRDPVIDLNASLNNADMRFYNLYLIGLSLHLDLPADKMTRLRRMLWHYPLSLFQFSGKVDIKAIIDDKGMVKVLERRHPILTKEEEIDELKEAWENGNL